MKINKKQLRKYLHRYYEYEKEIEKINKKIQYWCEIESTEKLVKTSRMKEACVQESNLNNSLVEKTAIKAISEIEKLNNEKAKIIKIEETIETIIPTLTFMQFRFIEEKYFVKEQGINRDKFYLSTLFDISPQTVEKKDVTIIKYMQKIWNSIDPNV
jgi:hypothetical protein